MKLKHGIRTLTLLALACLLALAVAAAGETVLSDAASLSALMNDPTAWGGHYKLGADIDLSGTAQTPIGSYDTPFTGSFDGAGHTVKLSMEADGTVGLFGVTEGATIRNLTVAGRVKNIFAATDAETKIDGKYPGTGALVGVALSGTTVEDCTTRASVEGPGNTGGLIGVVYNYGSDTVTIKNCTGEAEITSTQGNAGGLVGRIQTKSSAAPNALVSGCTNSSDVYSASEDRNRLAGIVGYVRTETGEIRIDGCMNSGKIKAENDAAKGSNNPYVGGIIGRIEAVTDASSAVRVLNCKNTGEIESSHHAGGIIAFMSRTDIAEQTATEIVGCLNTATVIGPSHAGGIVGYTQNRCGANVRSVVKDCENRGAVSSSACAGGLVGRWYGFDIVSSYNSGKVTADSLAGGIAGKAEGEIFCEANAVYLAGTAEVPVAASKPNCAELGIKSVTAAEAKTAGNFADFDFKSVWQIGNDGPTLAAFADGKMPVATEPAAPATSEPAATTAAMADVTTAEATADTTASSEPDTSAVSSEATTTEEAKQPEDTTASTAVTTASTDAETTDAPASSTANTPSSSDAKDDGGLPVWLYIVIAALVIALVVGGVILGKRKKS